VATLQSGTMQNRALFLTTGGNLEFGVRGTCLYKSMIPHQFMGTAHSIHSHPYLMLLPSQLALLVPIATKLSMCIPLCCGILVQQVG
jgi:hypothetical protein